MNKIINLWIATSNTSKVKEFKLLMKGNNFSKYFSSHIKNPDIKFLKKISATNFQLYALKDIQNYKVPKETGSSFKENARIKAFALKNLKPKEWILGEDSGLEVPALDNFPGIYSARYAGTKATDEDNLHLLLKNMKHLSDRSRTAFFVSHIVALSPNGKEYSAEGLVKGSISFTPTGKAGFGYDPIFIPKGETKSFAELGMKYKNRFSHRFKALMMTMLKTDVFHLI